MKRRLAFNGIQKYIYFKEKDFVHPSFSINLQVIQEEND